jgi:hypothetical protein
VHKGALLKTAVLIRLNKITAVHSGRSPSEIVGSSPTGGMDVCQL